MKDSGNTHLDHWKGRQFTRKYVMPQEDINSHDVTVGVWFKGTVANFGV